MSQYRYATTQHDYSALASGGVLLSAPGRPAFPVRLGLELFLRAWHLWQENSPPRSSPCTLYDPCCGAGYLLTVLKLLQWDKIGAVVGSDADPRAVELAGRNLDLLTPAGMAARQAELDQLARQYGKDSHREAAAHAGQLAASVMKSSTHQSAETHLFCADALDGAALVAGLGDQRADIVLTDIPYGQTTQWQTTQGQATQGQSETDPSSPEMIPALLAALRESLASGAVVVVAGLRAQMSATAAQGYRQLQRVRIGRREARIWRMV